MRRLADVLLFCLAFLFTLAPTLISQSHAAPWPPKRPRLVVFIVIDQFRADYLSRFQSQFRKDGFMALIGNGAYFPYGEYDILQSMTCPGHATVLTGAYPYQMGIPLNDWYDQTTHSMKYCAEDPDFKLVGASKVAEHAGTSPRNLTGTTVGDELKNVDIPSRMISVSLKDRSAIMMGGQRADLAFWFDHKEWRFLSSTYYLKDGKLPTWLETLNKSVADIKCDLLKPCAADLTVTAFKAALGEIFAKPSKEPGRTDIIALSFSAHDFAGHKFGPNAPEMKDMTLAEDKAIADIRAAVAKTVPGGLSQVLFVLTGDHGVAPTPEYLTSKGMNIGRLNETDLRKEIEARLNDKFGAVKSRQWLGHVIDFNFFIDEETVRTAKADLGKVQTEIKAALSTHPEFAHVFTRADYEARILPPGQFERQILKTYYPGRSGHVIGLQKPFFLNDAHHTANHMTGYTYDRMVPIVFSGFGIKNGLFADKAEVIDIAPTLAFLLGVLPPALSEGKVLKQALKVN